MDVSQLSSPCEWKYLGRGNANAVFRYHGPSTYLKKKVLRLRLHKPLEDYISTMKLIEYVKNYCEMHLSKYLIKYEMVEITRDFITLLDTQDFNLMLTERHGILLDDMLCGEYTTYNISKHCKLHIDNRGADISCTNSVILELKPKWLYDNETNYCRNCALNQYRKLERHFCPLDFLSEPTVERGIDDLLSKFPKEVSSIAHNNSYFKLRKLLRAYLTSSDNIFHELKRLQEVKSKTDFISNVKTVNDVSDALSFVMTMRDVGVFITFTRYRQADNIDREVNNVVTVDGVENYLISSHVYDLDLKPKSKYEHWKNTDLALQDYYDSYVESWRLCTRTPG